MKALTSSCRIRSRNRIQLPIKTMRKLCTELGMPQMEGYAITFKIISIVSPDGIEFIDE